MNTITITVPPVRAITRAAASDWGPTLRQWAGVIAAIVTVVYVAGMIAGERWHRFTAALLDLQQQAIGRLGLPGATVKDSLPVRPPVVRHLAPAPAPVLTRRDACRRLRAQGLSPAAIGRELGISRSTVRRELAV